MIIIIIVDMGSIGELVGGLWFGERWPYACYSDSFKLLSGVLICTALVTLLYDIHHIYLEDHHPGAGVL